MPDRIIVKIVQLFLVTALLSPLVIAQPEPLYRVELLVFSQPSGATAEQWEAIPKLEYPNRSRFLIYPGEQQTGPAGLSGTSTAASSAIGTETAPIGPTQPLAFATVSPGDRQFAGKADAMQRSGRYRILFHEAWMQPMGGQSETLPIVLDRSGDGGPWPALQGTIKVYLSRYFYLETNLWLNTQGEYLQSSWRMPAPPLAPASSARKEVMPVSTNQINGTTYQQQPSPQTAMVETLEPDYPFRHAVLLQQTRRMRSGEVAYLDHPLLGVLIKITPLNGADGDNAE
jgi:Peptidoglycan-binding protein, CsiV